MNALKHVKPMVWIDEVPWHEMDDSDELRLRTTGEWARYHEWELRKLLYQWEHMPADMVVEPVVWSPLVVHNTGFGIAEDVDIAVTDEANSIVSRHFKIQIQDEDDLDKIKVPVVTHDAAASEEHYEQLAEIMDGVVEVRKLGANGFCFWFAPWDEMIRWWGVQEAMVDLYDRPEFVHKAIDKLVNAYCAMLDQFEEQNLLTLNNAYTGSVPAVSATPTSCRHRTTTPRTCGPRTSGAAAPRRSSRTSPRACTGSSPCSTS